MTNTIFNFSSCLDEYPENIIRGLGLIGTKVIFLPKTLDDILIFFLKDDKSALLYTNLF